MVRFLWYACTGLPSWTLLLAVRCYQLLVSPWFGPRCRFQPTCSSYFAASVRQYGALRGSLRGLKRIVRCHPWNPGGYDPP
ncbi:MAG: membrane protein insertion efficiency factor YidD [Planctomycetes bacterium]|nr:membrane protein insertion efficiency factor YidD [Planctomycetota bacterium]